MEDFEARLLRLEAQRFVHGFVLKYLIAALSPAGAQHSALREKLCGAVERIYERRPESFSASPEGLLSHQMALAEVEALFDLPTPRAE